MNKKKLLRKARNIIAAIMTLIVMATGTIQIVQASNKIMLTTFELILISDDVNFYNQRVNKNERNEVYYDLTQSRRQELYTSEDFIISRYSSIENHLIKVCIMILSILMYPALVIMWRNRFCVFYRKLRRCNLTRKREQDMNIRTHEKVSSTD